MKVLLVSHDFLPNHPSGTEIYTAQLGKKLRERGHDVHVFTTEKDVSKANLRVELRNYEGLPVHELTNNLFYNEYRETWDYPPAEESFRLFLDDLEPDVVHFMHLMYLSVGCVEEVRRRGIPVLFTLHDYWLQCARFGQRIHADGRICHTIDFDECGRCMARFKYRQTRLERATAKAITTVRSKLGLDLAPGLRRVADAFRSDPRKSVRAPELADADAAPPTATEAPPAGDPDARRMAREVEVRDRMLRERLLPTVDLFVAPSRFLRDRFVEWGIPERQIIYNRAGIDTTPLAGFQRRDGEGLRVAYIGTLAPHKGVHVLLEAWARIDPARRAKGKIEVYGPKSHYPGYVRHLETLCQAAGTRLAGGLAAAEVQVALAGIDVLVVPSVWYENSPLIILEALATRTPLIVSDLGGMAELVQHGETGYTFPVGDADALAELLGRLLDDPAELDELFGDAPPIKSIETDARELEGLYEQLRERGRDGS